LGIRQYKGSTKEQLTSNKSALPNREDEKLW